MKLRGYDLIIGTVRWRRFLFTSGLDSLSNLPSEFDYSSDLFYVSSLTDGVTETCKRNVKEKKPRPTHTHTRTHEKHTQNDSLPFRGLMVSLKASCSCEQQEDKKNNWSATKEELKKLSLPVGLQTSRRGHSCWLNTRRWILVPNEASDPKKRRLNWEAARLKVPERLSATDGHVKKQEVNNKVPPAEKKKL